MPDGTYRAGFEAIELTGVVTGTRILTRTGECRVEHLQEGDILSTADGGEAVLMSVERRTFRATGAAAPIRIIGGTLQNLRDLAVAPGQYVALGEVNVPAGSLVGQTAAEIAYGGMVTYHHLGFERDTVVWAEGAHLAFPKRLSVSDLLALSGQSSVESVRLI